MTRAYRLVGRLKNNRLWAAIVRAFPDVRTQSEAARAVGLTPATLGDWLNMTRWPGLVAGGWSPAAAALAAQLYETPEHLFDRDLYGQTPRPLDVELDRPALQAAGVVALPEPDPEQVALAKEQRVEIQSALAYLTPNQRRVLMARYGLDEARPDGGPQLYEEIGQRLGVTRERVRQIEAKALRRLSGTDAPDCSASGQEEAAQDLRDYLAPDAGYVIKGRPGRRRVARLPLVVRTPAKRKAR